MPAAPAPCPSEKSRVPDARSSAARGVVHILLVAVLRRGAGERERGATKAPLSSAVAAIDAVVKKENEGKQTEEIEKSQPPLCMLSSLNVTYKSTGAR